MTNKKEVESTNETIKLISAISAQLTPLNNVSSDNPWSPDEIDKLEHTELKDFRQKIKSCRFFYHKDPLSATTINKLVEIGITKLSITQNSLSDNEYRIFEAIKPSLKLFAENMALEYLLTGLVVPEIQYTAATRDELKFLDIKKYTSLILPTSMWIRDPATITIESSELGPVPSYFVEVPQKLVSFIQNNGVYPDGNVDRELYEELKILYPDFIAEIKAGRTKILIENDLIFRRKVTTESAYPIPYLEPAIESLFHKRNLRRMDYSIAARVISAILLFRLGDKDFPLTAENQDELESLKNQIFWRDGTGKNVERIFQLFANHTLQIDWIMPDTEALLSDSKYKDINQEIIFALGFPRVLITGEAERTGTSDPQFSMMSPTKTMEDFRDKIIVILQDVINEVSRRNNLKYTPKISFEPINLIAFEEFFTALSTLYTSGNLSREVYSGALGINWTDEMNKKEAENKVLKEKQLGEYAPQAFSNPPNTPQDENNNNPIEQNKKNLDKKTKSGKK